MPGRHFPQRPARRRSRIASRMPNLSMKLLAELVPLVYQDLARAG